MTASMNSAIDETYRRRDIQRAYNVDHGITPQGIQKAVKDISERIKVSVKVGIDDVANGDFTKEGLLRLVKELESQMKKSAKSLEFEKAAMLRDEIVELRKILVAEAN